MIKFNSKLDLINFSFFKEIDRLDPDIFIPNHDDIVRIKYKKMEDSFIRTFYKDLKITLIDRGRSSINQLKEKLSYIVYFVPLSKYNDKLDLDGRNRLTGIIEIFGNRINTDKSISIFLCLNKFDIFQENIRKFKDFKNFFPDFEGEQEPMKCLDYILDKFLSQNQHKERKIYVYITNCIHYGNMMNTFIDLKEKIYILSQGNGDFQEKFIYLPAKNEFYQTKFNQKMNIYNTDFNIFFSFQ